MNHLFRPAGWVLLTQMVAVGLWLWFTGRLEPVSVQDTPTYVAFSWNSPAEILGDFRTPGYPAFLAVVAPHDNFVAVPVAHYIVFCLGVIVFWWGLMALGGAGGRCAWVATALLYSNILHGYVATVASDTLAPALAIASVGLLFLAIIKPKSLVLLALCVMATYLVRPAYLSLVLLIPLLGVAVQMSRRVERPTRRQLTQTFGVLLLTTMIPLLGYCSLRAVVVGRFGIVASGGVNLIGIAGQFLDQQTVASLPEDLQPLATRALTHRPPENENEIDLMTTEPVLNYQRIENRYDWTIWDVFYPAAVETDSTEVSSANSRLRRLAQEIIRRHPVMYAVYLAKAFRRAVYKVVGDSLLNPCCLGLSLLIMMAVVRRILWPRDPVKVDQDEQPVYRLLDVMLLTTLSFAVAQMLVVILVCPPLGRLTDAMALFVPALLMAILVERRASV